MLSAIQYHAITALDWFVRIIKLSLIFPLKVKRHYLYYVIKLNSVWTFLLCGIVILRELDSLVWCISLGTFADCQYCNVRRIIRHQCHVSPWLISDDKTRVHLEMVGDNELSDYINASHIQVLHMRYITHIKAFPFNTK